MKLNNELIKYYDLHGCVCKHNLLVIPMHKFKITTDDEFIYFHRSCNALEGDKCTLHPHGKPAVCNEFQENKLVDSNKYFAVKECLANYK